MHRENYAEQERPGFLKNIFGMIFAVKQSPLQF